MHRVRAFLKFAGKGQRKVVAVFAATPAGARRAVAYMGREIPDFPIWLFCSVEPGPEAAARCERVIVEADSMALLVAAEKELWPFNVALTAGAWTGERGKWPVKLAPLLVPPHRSVLLNRHGDWFPGTPRNIRQHAARAVYDQAHSAWNSSRDVHRAAWLWLLGKLADVSLPLIRRAFWKWHGREPLSGAPVLSAGDGIVEFRYSHRQWDAAKLSRLLRQSTARLVLFVDGDADANVEDMLPLFEDERTFAVSRQIGYRGWKPFTVPLAPFRRLQRGEFSRTLAPVSNVVLADRAKLAALGVPRAFVPGAAWLVWFWRAAAAGWRSYSAGAAGLVPEFPYWPFEVAEFVARTLGKPAGPRDTELARGNIAAAIPERDAKPKAGGRPTVLVVSPHLPYPLAHGGAVRIYNLCRALSDRADFILACFRERGETVHYGKLHEVFREVYVVDRDERASRDKRFPLQVREHASGAMRALIANLAPCANILQVEFTHLAAFREAAPHIPAILVEHDITFMLYGQYAAQHPGWNSSREYERWLDFEKTWLARYDAVWTMSDEDFRLAARSGSKAAFVVANGVDIERFVPTGEPAGAPEVFYIGSFRHRPNVIGFERLRLQIMPRVWERFPEAILRVVAGPEPEAYWSGAADSRVVMHGFVEDVRPLYARAHVVAVPLVVSAGTNIKVMEAMACGRPVVTTSVGCQGLTLADGYDAVICDEPAAFAAAICRLLVKPDEARRIAENARRTVEARFAWEAIAHEAYSSYTDLIGVAARCA